MEENQGAVPADGTKSTSGDFENNKTEDQSNKFTEKLLKEKKNTVMRNQALEKELEELKQWKAEAEESRLKEQEKWKEMYEKRDIEKKELLEKLNQTEKSIFDGHKVNALKSELNKLGIKENYLEKAVKLVDLDSIRLDNETSTVVNADEHAKAIYDEWSDLFGQSNTNVSHDSTDPVGTSGPMSIEDWRKLPLAEKKKRQADVFKANGIELRR